MGKIEESKPSNKEAMAGSGEPSAPTQDFWQRNYPALLVALVAFSFITKTLGLDQPAKEVYDEVYFAFTAALMAKGDPIAYSVHATPPPGFAYEWTHPPLGKLIIAAGIKIFGNVPFGWRISSAIFGTLITLLTSMLAFELFKSARIALLAGFFTSVEGLLFVHSRISMVDAHLITFLLGAAHFYARWVHDPQKRLPNLFAVGACLGLAASTKWNSVFMTLLIGPDLVFRWLIKNELPFRNWVAWFGLALVLLPGGIYLASHIQFFSLGYPFDAFTNLQRSMWWYHTNLAATHPYASTIWEWLANIRPVWMYRVDSDGRIGLIYGIGNHVVLYSALVAVALSIRRLIQRWSWELGFVFFAYFVLFVPWCLSPRIKFFYHYAPSVPFLCIMLAHTLHLTSRDEVEGAVVRPSFATSTTIVLSLAWFAVLYPFMTGAPVSKGFVDIFDLIIMNPMGTTTATR